MKVEERLEKIEESIATIKDNHLHHLEKDVATMAVKMDALDDRMGLIEGLLRDNFNRIIMGLLVLAGAAVGIDLMGVGA